MTTTPRGKRFSVAQRQALRRLDGLTSPQLDALEKALRTVAFELEPSARLIDVRDELQALAKDLGAAARRVMRWERAKRPAPGCEALGHLNLAGAQLGRAARPDDGTWPDYVVGSEAIKLAAAIADAALAGGPRAKRVAAPASWRAIDAIYEALWRPEDDKSRAAAAALPVTRTEARRLGPSFRRVAQVAFQCATGNQRANPDRSIREYLARRAQPGG